MRAYLIAALLAASVILCGCTEQVEPVKGNNNTSPPPVRYDER
jgi:hypothetical protein